MAGTGGHSPLEQFEIHRLIEIEIGGLDVSFTNSALVMVISLAAITLLMTLGMRRRALVPGRWQSLAEMSYEFAANLLRLGGTLAVVPSIIFSKAC